MWMQCHLNPDFHPRTRPQSVRLQNGSLTRSRAAQGHHKALSWPRSCTSSIQQTSNTTPVDASSRNFLMLQLSLVLLKGGEDNEYRSVIRYFVDWTDNNHLYLNTTKTKEMVVDFRRRIQPAPAPNSIQDLRNPSHPLSALRVVKRSTFSERLIMPRCKSECSRRSFLPAAMTLYNEHL